MFSPAAFSWYSGASVVGSSSGGGAASGSTVSSSPGDSSEVKAARVWQTLIFLF